MSYLPRQGDIAVMNFQPQTGHEQRGRRSALVISNESFHRYTGMAIVCPITNTDGGFPMHVRLRGSLKTRGVVMCEQVKSLDYTARAAVFVEEIPEEILTDVLERVRLSLV